MRKKLELQRGTVEPISTAEDFNTTLSKMDTLYATMIMETYHLYIYPNPQNVHQEWTITVNCELWVTMMWQCRFINYNKCSILVRSADHGGGCACLGATGIWDLSVTSPQFFWELKTALKNCLNKKMQKDLPFPQKSLIHMGLVFVDSVPLEMDRLSLEYSFQELDLVRGGSG